MPTSKKRKASRSYDPLSNPLSRPVGDPLLAMGRIDLLVRLHHHMFTTSSPVEVTSKVLRGWTLVGSRVSNQVLTDGFRNADRTIETQVWRRGHEWFGFWTVLAQCPSPDPQNPTPMVVDYRTLIGAPRRPPTFRSWENLNGRERLMRFRDGLVNAAEWRGLDPVRTSGAMALFDELSARRDAPVHEGPLTEMLSLMCGSTTDGVDKDPEVESVRLLAGLSTA